MPVAFALLGVNRQKTQAYADSCYAMVKEKLDMNPLHELDTYITTIGEYKASARQGDLARGLHPFVTISRETGAGRARFGSNASPANERHGPSRISGLECNGSRAVPENC